MSQSVLKNPFVSSDPILTGTGTGTLVVSRLTHFSTTTAYRATCISASPCTFAITPDGESPIGVAVAGVEFFDPDLKIFLTIEQGLTPFIVGDYFDFEITAGTDLSQENLDSFEELPQKNFGAGVEGTLAGDHNLRFSNTSLYASLFLQDLKFTALTAGSTGDSLTIAYTTGATAGAEVVTVAGTDISVQISSGRSTATQVKTALDAHVTASTLISTTIIGLAGNAQVGAVAATSFTGGKNKNFALNHNELTDAGAFVEGNANLKARDVTVLGDLDVTKHAHMREALSLNDAVSAHGSGDAIPNVQKRINQLSKYDNSKIMVDTVGNANLSWTSPDLTGTGNIEIRFKDSAIVNTIGLVATTYTFTNDGDSLYAILDPENTRTLSASVEATVPVGMTAFRIATRFGTSLITYNGTLITTGETAKIGGGGATSANTASAIVKRDASGNFVANNVTVNDLVVAGDLTVQGTTTTIDTANLLVEDKLVTINNNGAAASGGGSGLEVEEDGSVTGYVKTSADRNGWEFKAPNTAGVATLTPGSGADAVVLAAATQVLTGKTFDDAITGKQISTPSNPSANYNKLYFKSDDKLYRLTSAGVEVEVGSADDCLEHSTTGGNLTLTSTSAPKVIFVDNTARDCVLPATSTMIQGQGFILTSATDSAIAQISVKAAGGSLVKLLNVNDSVTVICNDISVDNAASWSITSHNIREYATGDLLYASAANTLSRLPIGSANQIVKSVAGVPAWAPAPTGGINYISANSDAEVDTTGWATYADAAQNIPVDGTGGSPASTWTRSTSSPLRGTANFLWTRTAANRQGEGVSYAFTLDAADKAKPLGISFDYSIASGTFFAADGITAPLNDGTTSQNAGMSDLEVFIYDVTNSALIPVSGQVLTSASSIAATYKGTFQTSATGTSYRLIIHTARSTAVAFTANFDNFYVGPQVMAFGPAVSDWTAYTLAIGAVSGGTVEGAGASKSALWRRVGDSMEIQFRYSQTAAGTAGTGTYWFPLPSGYTIDTTKVTVGTGAVGSGITPVGHGQVAQTTAESTSTASPATMFAYDANNLYMVTSTTAGQLRTVKGGGFDLSSNPAYYSFTARVPISGWSSNTVMSADSDTRVVAARYRISAARTPSTTKSVNYDTKDFDTHAAVTTVSGDVAGWKFTAPVSGVYKIGLVAYTQAASAGSMIAYKNGVADVVLATINTTNPQGGANSIYLNAGDYIDIRSDTTPNLHPVYSGMANVVSIERISGPAVVAASESVTVKYFNTAGTTFGTGGGVLVFPTKQKDSHSAFASGVFTAPVSATYAYSASIVSSTANSASNDYILQAQKNASTVVSAQRQAGTGAADTYFSLATNGIIDLLAGETLAFYAITSAGTITLSTVAGYNQVSIWKVGN